jgi:thiosulfate dehydrogenase
MGRLFTGIILGMVLLPVLFVLYCLSGLFPATAMDSPLPLEPAFAAMALHAAVSRGAPKTAPLQPTDDVMLAGVRVYRQNCAVCHGVSGQAPTAIAKGMSPRPPALFEGHGVTDDLPGETFFKAKYGIRLTGMPGFRDSLSDDELWQVSLLLANADKMSPAVRQALTAPESEPPAQFGQPAHP